MLGFIFVTIGGATSAFLESVILSHFFKGEEQPKSQGYVGIHTGTSGSGFDQFFDFSNHGNLGEMTASTNPNYSRQAVTWSTPDSNSTVWNDITISFSASSAHTDNIDSISIFDSATEATGNILITNFSDPDWGFGQTGPLSGGTSYEINPGDLRVGHGNSFVGGFANSQMTPYLQEKWIRRFLMNEDIATANGQYLGLMTVAPSWDTYFYSGEGITWNAGQEVAAADYTRTPITWSEIENLSSVPQIGNINNIRIIPNSNWGTLNAVGIWDAQTGGNLLVYTILTETQIREMISGREINILSGTIHISEIAY